MKRITSFLFLFGMTAFLYARDSDSIRLTMHAESNEDYVFCLHNNTNDSVYLFDAYFEECYDGYIYSSMYVHRYDKKQRKFKLSLVPIFQTTGWKGCLDDIIVLGKDKIAKHRNVSFSFKTIAPFDSLLVCIKKDAFSSLAYVYDIYTEDMSCYHPVLPKMKKKILKKTPDEIIFELGVYKKVDNLLKWCNEVDYNEAWKQAKDMIVISLPVRMNR